MNKMKKAIIGLAVGAVAALGVVGFAACGSSEQTVEGEYHYANSWDETAPDYGIKVKVTVKDNKITKVEIVKSDYVEVTDSWKDKAIWNDNIDDLLAAYKGKTVDEVKKASVTLEDSVPTAVGDEDLLITGATQGSGRLLKAVQDALADL